MSTTIKRFELWVATTAFGVWMSKTLASRIDPWIYRRSGGRFTSLGPVVVPQLVLTTRGRKSGQERDAQLAYTELGGSVYVVASNFGGERHPAWSYNLQADPEAVMHLAGERMLRVRGQKPFGDAGGGVYALPLDVEISQRVQEVEVFRLDLEGSGQRSLRFGVAPDLLQQKPAIVVHSSLIRSFPGDLDEELVGFFEAIQSGERQRERVRRVEIFGIRLHDLLE